MAGKVVWSEPAWEDLEAAANFIARDSQTYSAAFAQEVKEAAKSLQQFAERGQVVPELGDTTIRELLVKPYRLVYKILDEEVLVLALIHSARRLWRV